MFYCHIKKYPEIVFDLQDMIQVTPCEPGICTFFVPFQVSGIEMRSKMDDLLPIILDMLQDSSALQKREVM